MCPYYLEEQNTYGFIIDFKFSKNIDVLFDKEVQKLSLSLDVNGRSNKIITQINLELFKTL